MEGIKRWEDSAFLGWAVSSYHVRVGNPSRSSNFRTGFECGACVRQAPDAVWGKSSIESMSLRMWIRRRSKHAAAVAAGAG